MALIDGEKVLFRSDSGDLVLTTHRVRYGSEESDLTSIMLEEVCSVEITRHTHRWLALVGWILLALAGLLGTTAMRTVPVAEVGTYMSYACCSVILSSLFFLAYYLTRFRVVRLASAGATIEWVLKRKGGEYAAEFVDQLEVAKDRRLMLFVHTAEVKPNNSVATAGT